MAGLGKILVVCGPTATGKTALALHLARSLGGEVVGADSMQVYTGLTIGTAAPTPGEMAQVPYHLVGHVPPQQPYSVAAWLQDAEEAIDEIRQKGRVPVVCGGTGLYIQSLVMGLRFTEENDDGLRAQLYAEWETNGAEEMHRRLAAVDPARAAVLHVNDKKRVLRALQQCMATGQTAEERLAASRRVPPRWQSLAIGLHYSTRAALYAAIDSRVDEMMQRGLLEEARTVWHHRAQYATAAQAIGYKEFFPYFEDAAPLADCTARLKQASRNYAKRQLTWFGGMQGIHWLAVDEDGVLEKAQALAQGFLQPE
ncbi:tRNA (adenosine(37)-N6)-dimethylallyltransferase MiaA [Ruminococcaceae bacterium OttesenSCG-928-O06]|nr:tRNA (adenosine(37)-N6)-dimethylallyltransferase MiaA [Ruminococcaceae bacterium OttesenSCG-928-O06]